MKLKRILLIVVLFPFLPLLPGNELYWSRNMYYEIVTTFLAIYSIMINFPKLVKISHTKALTFSDLEDEKYENPVAKRRFQVIFIVVLQIFDSIMLTSLLYYYFNKYQNSQFAGVEILGIVGGFISLLGDIEKSIGRVILFILNHIKTNTPRFESQNSKENSRIRKFARSLSDMDSGSRYNKRRCVSFRNSEDTLSEFELE